MKSLIVRLLGVIWNDEKAARALIRGTIGALAVGGAVFAGDLAALVNAPKLVSAIKVASVFAVFVAHNVIGGQSNPLPDDGSQK
jgi:hypothetical protein